MFLKHFLQFMNLHTLQCLERSFFKSQFLTDFPDVRMNTGFPYPELMDTEDEIKCGFSNFEDEWLEHPL